MSSSHLAGILSSQFKSCLKNPGCVVKAEQLCSANSAFQTEPWGGFGRYTHDGGAGRGYRGWGIQLMLNQSRDGLRGSLVARAPVFKGNSKCQVSQAPHSRFQCLILLNSANITLRDEKSLFLKLNLSPQHLTSVLTPFARAGGEV